MHSNWFSADQAARRVEHHERGRQTSKLRDRTWTAAVERLDELLRRHYGVFEYTNAPDCVFRIAFVTAACPLLLSDNTLIRAGDTIGCLHFWNDHLPPFPPAGPDLAWAKTMQSRVCRSLHYLCAYVERDPDWRDIKSFRGDAPVPFRPLAREQMRRLAKRHGFEPGGEEAPGNRVTGMAENMLLWSFARAYNPAALSRHDLRQGRQPLWFSRNSLLARYGSD